MEKFAPICLFSPPLPEWVNALTATPLAKSLLRSKRMRAMALTRPASGTVEAVDLDLRAPGPWEVSVRVLACGVCRTDLHVVDGDLSDATTRIVPGHEIVGRIEQVGE